MPNGQVDNPQEFAARDDEAYSRYLAVSFATSVWSGSLLLGSAVLVFALCSLLNAETLSNLSIAFLLSLVIALLIGMYLGAQRYYELAEHYNTPDGFTDDDRYGWALRGLGFSLFFVGVLIISAFAGLMSVNRFSDMFAGGNEESIALILISAAVANFGTLMFVHKRIKSKQERGEPFSMHKFWAGLSFRCGQAVLYTVAVTLLIYSRLAQNSLGLAMLPIIALFIGMYVTCAEGLFFSIGNRLRGMIAAAVGVDDSEESGLKRYRCELDPELDANLCDDIERNFIQTKGIVLARVLPHRAFIVTTANGPTPDWIRAQFFIFAVNATVAEQSENANRDNAEV